MTTETSQSGRIDAEVFGVSFNLQSCTARVFGADQLAQELDDPNVFSWIDVEGPNIEALNEVLRLREIDLVLVSHFGRPEILPRIIERPDCLAFYVYEIFDPDRHLDISRELTEVEVARVLVVLGEDYVVTFHRRQLDAVDYVKQTCVDNFHLAGKTANFIVFLLLHRCLYDYAHLNLANDNFLDMLEELVLNGDHEEMAAKISIAASNILTLKRLTTSLHIVLMLLVTKRSRFVSDAARTSYGEMLQNAMSVRASIDSSRDMLDGVVRSIQARAANRTSEIARVLTVVSAIILPLSLIAGIYGMNFQNMPELGWENGYYGVLALMVIIALALLVTFYALGWFGSDRTRR